MLADPLGEFTVRLVSLNNHAARLNHPETMKLGVLRILRGGTAHSTITATHWGVC